MSRPVGSRRIGALRSHLNTQAHTASAYNLDHVVIVSAVRTPICRAGKRKANKHGKFSHMHPETLLATALKGAMDRAGVEAAALQDVAVGNVLSEQSLIMARTGAMLAGIPSSVPVQAIDRQCASGLQAVVAIAEAIASGRMSLGIGAGVECMSRRGMADIRPEIAPQVFSQDNARNCLTPMGVTSENVAERFGVTRAQQDEFSLASHKKAAKAQTAGKFAKEIVPVLSPVDEDQSDFTLVDADDGVRADTTLDQLSRLRPSFKEDGTTTAGNSSQVSDGAAACVVASKSYAEQHGLPQVAQFLAFEVVGVPPEIMGIGPAEAIPRALAAARLTVDDIDVFEINEAFASQLLYCVRKLGIPEEKLNPNGGAIALGHPLGCTGARMIATLVSELERRGGGLGVVSMCVGTGMGAAAVLRVFPPQKPH